MIACGRRTRCIFNSVWLALAVIALAAVGCGSRSPKSEAPDENLVEYSVRGRIVQLPAPDRPASQLIVHHEPLPSYMSGGEVVGMGEMHMPFPIKDGVSLDEFEVGDAITLTFEVRYDPETQIPVMIQATRLRALPEGTLLVFESDTAGPPNGE